MKCSNHPDYNPRTSSAYVYYSCAVCTKIWNARFEPGELVEIIEGVCCSSVRSAKSTWDNALNGIPRYLRANDTKKIMSRVPAIVVSNVLSDTPTTNGAYRSIMLCVGPNFTGWFLNTSLADI